MTDRKGCKQRDVITKVARCRTPIERVLRVSGVNETWTQNMSSDVTNIFAF